MSIRASGVNNKAHHSMIARLYILPTVKLPFSRVNGGYARLCMRLMLQIQDKTAFIILFHAATMREEKAPWLPVHFQDSLSTTKSQQLPPHPKHLDKENGTERGLRGQMRGK